MLTFFQIFQDNSLGGKYNITGFYADGFGVCQPTLEATGCPANELNRHFTKAVAIA